MGSGKWEGGGQLAGDYIDRSVVRFFILPSRVRGHILISIDIDLSRFGRVEYSTLGDKGYLDMVAGRFNE